MIITLLLFVNALTALAGWWYARQLTAVEKCRDAYLQQRNAALAAQCLAEAQLAQSERNYFDQLKRSVDLEMALIRRVVRVTDAAGENVSLSDELETRH